MVTTHSSLLLKLRSRDDTDAWNRFVKIYTPLVHHWVSRLIQDGNQSADVAQEVFVVLLGKVSWIAENRPKSFTAWLRTVTINKCRDHLRSKKRKSEPQLLQIIEVAESDPISILTEEEYRRFVAQSALRLMQDAFSETTWQACWQQVALGKSATEIATNLGISENAVYLARARVLKRLRAELDGLWE